MKANELRRRWKDRSFVQQQLRLLHDLFTKGELVGPADLKGLGIGVDFPVEIAQHGELLNASVTDVDFQASSFSCKFTNGTFVRTDFAESVFDTCLMHGTAFTECRLDDCSFSNPYFNQSVATSCSFRGARFRARRGIIFEYELKRSRFVGCDLSGATFRAVMLRGTTFERCTLEGAIFDGCPFFGVTLNESSLDRTKMVNCAFKGRNVGLEKQ